MSCNKPIRFILSLLCLFSLSFISTVSATRLTNGQNANYLEYSTLLGGEQDEFVRNMIATEDGGAMIILYTNSTGLFAAKTTSSNYDTFIFKLDPAGTITQVIGPLGGSGNDFGEALSIDTNGDIILVGHTTSPDLPVTTNAINTVYQPSYEHGFLMKLNPDGSQIKYCSYISGERFDAPYGIKRSPDGNFIITGYTMSSTFPVTTDAFDTTLNGGSDIFLMKLTNACDSIIFATYIGGSDQDNAGATISIDSLGNIYLAGDTRSPDFPVTSNAYDTSYNINYSDTFALKINSTGSALIYSTFIGGTNNDYASGSALLPDGRFAITGYTDSSNYPTTTTNADNSYGGNIDGFLTILNTNGTDLSYSSYLGGLWYDYNSRMVADENGYLTLIGNAAGTVGFPLSPGAMDSTHNGHMDGTIMRIDSNTGTIIHSTLFGGNDMDSPMALAVGEKGSVWIAGWTGSTTGFPCTINSQQSTFRGSYYDAFYMKITPGWYLQPKFSATTVSGIAPLTVNFIEESFGAPDYWNWSFGDGQSTTFCNPTHTYTTPGKYTVHLQTSNYFGSAGYGRPDYIKVYGSSTIDFPAIKLVLGESLPNALAIADYDPEGLGVYELSGNFLGMATLSNGTVSLAGWSQPTSGFVYLTLTHPGITLTAKVPIKISTYRISKLPHFAFDYTGPSYIDMSQYVTSSAGPAIPESFGNNSCLTYDHDLVSASWVNQTTLCLSMGPYFYRGYRVSLDIIASPNSSSPYGPDMDRERLDIWSNQLPYGDMMDTTQWVWGNWGKEMLADYSATPEWGYLPQIIDSKGQIANDIWRFSFTSTNQAIKLTPGTNQWYGYGKNQWGIARMRVMSPTPDNDLQVGLFNFNGIIPSSPHVDIACNILFGVPTVWTWIEAPVYTQDTGIAYFQLVLKPGTKKGVLYIDEVHIMDDTPYVIDTRSQSALKYPYRSFSSLTELSYGWSTTEGDCPLNIVDDAVQFDFSKATTGIQYGKKLTAQLNQTGVYTPSSMPDHEVGFKAYVEKTAGALDSYGSIVLMALYGVPSNGSYDFWSAGGQLMASAEFGRINDGYHYVIGPGRNGYHQFQFIANSDVPGKINVRNLDFLRDLDDPYFGDISLW